MDRRQRDERLRVSILWMLRADRKSLSFISAAIRIRIRVAMMPSFCFCFFLCFCFCFCLCLCFCSESAARRPGLAWPACCSSLVGRRYPAGQRLYMLSIVPRPATPRPA